MTNIFQNIGEVTTKALPVLVNSLIMPKLVNRDYEGAFGDKPYQIGDTLNIRKPASFVAKTDGTQFVAQGFQQSTIPLQIMSQPHVDVSLTSKEMSLNMDNFMEMVVEPAVIELANKIDADILSLSDSAYNLTGTLGTIPSGLSAFQAAWSGLADAPAPMDKQWVAVVEPFTQTGVVQGVQTLFNPTQEISKQYIKNRMGMAAGLDWYMDQNVNAHTTGAYAATIGSAVTTNGVVSSGSSSITLAGWTSGDTLAAGDVVYFTGVYRVNLRNRQPSRDLQGFVVQSAATASGGGAMTITVSPTPQFSGANQNVYSSSGTIANGTTIASVNGKTGANATAVVSKQNLVFHPDAITFAPVKLVDYQGGAISSRVTDKQTGISMRLSYFADGYVDKQNMRIDVLYGKLLTRPELAYRVQT